MISPSSPVKFLLLPRCCAGILLFLLLLVGSIPNLPAAAQSQVVELHHEYLFGEDITFQANLQAGSPVDEALLFIQVEGEDGTREIPIDPVESGELVARLDMAEQSIRAFSTVTYWFEVSLQGGEKIASDRSSFAYEDNRFSWQVREAPPFRIHWYEGGTEFAQNVEDTAEAGFDRVQSLLPLETPDQIDIYVYSTAAEMQATLNQASQNWVVAGHADPDLGVMVVALPAGPDQRLLMEQRIPHEMMHILLYQKLQEDYANLPVWLGEGLASSAELYPNPDYLILLNSTQEKGALIPMASLCRTFPRDASSALLAYAQSASFTRYFHQQYGSSGLENLLEHYQDGLDCERGVLIVTGEDLAQVEKSWRQDVFGENFLLTAVKKLLPWLVLLFAVLLLPVGLTLGSLRRRPSNRDVRPDLG